MRVAICVTGCCVLLVGCSRIEPLEPGPDHPANPQAASAEEASSLDVLTVDEANLPQVPPEMRRAGGNHQRHPGMDGGDAPTVKQVIGSHTCSMHPDVRADRPGKCPKCGMRLVPMGASDNE